MRGDLPSGTVTFLFTDVEGSTKLLHSLGAEGYAQALAEHRRVIREACASEGGVEVDTQGDAFFFAFPTAPGALAAARGLTERLAAEGPIRVRVGLHTGTPLLGEEGYIGHDLHRAARIAASGHGGQVILSGATASLVDLELADLGEHRLKDIAEPVPIFQLGAERFPPLKTISNTNLPRPASSFLGREAELAEVVSRIEQGARLVTLTGPGGTGKTRLALEAASTLVGEYKAGVFWVGLASLRDPAIVTETIAQVLGAKGGLAEHISEREMLLLLDNLEQVIEAASELASLLESCPNLTVLVTSRELLRVRGEVEYPVPPLAELEAIELFCARSQLEPSAEIAELCARLDSLPLAVELAAARTKGLTPAQIVERLSSRLDLLKGGRDADPRQLTLRATIEWSYDLLTQEEQLLFARLSAFAGGCTLEAAEEVCNADLDTLQSLVEKSLVRFTAYETGGRYWMLETIRGYAAELAATDTGLAVRHSEWIREHVLDGASMWPGQARADGWYEKVDLERDNIRAALESFHARGREADVGLVIGAVGGFWDTLGFGRECDRWLEIALESVTDERLRVRLLTLACRRAGFRHDTDLAMALATELAGLGDRLGDGAVIAAASFDLARAYEIAGNVDAAFDSYSRSAEHWLGVNDGNAAAALVNLAGIELVKGNYAEARRRALASLDISETVKFPEGVITSCGHIGSSLLREGAVDDARPWFRRALAGVLEHRRVILAPGLLVEVASLGTRTHGLERSVVVIGAADAIARSAATELEDDSEQRAAAVLGEAAGLLGSDRVEALLREGSSLNWEQAIEYALASI